MDNYMEEACRQYWKAPILAFIASFLLFSPALAEEQAVVAATVDAEAVVTASTDDADELEDMVVETVAKVPRGFGLWWRGLRENVSLFVTIDPVKKIEKQIKFAEERVQIAEKIAAESDDPDKDARAEKMIERANMFLGRVEEKKDRLLQNPDARKRQVLKNIVTHQIRKEKALDRIEANVPEEKRVEFEALRKRAEERNERLLNAIENENIPGDVREHLLGVKARIEARAEVQAEFREKRKELQESGVRGEELKEELQKLLETRKEGMNVIREERKEAMQKNIENVRERAENGDEAAAKQLERMKERREERAEKQEVRQERREDRRERIEDRKELRLRTRVEGEASIQ